MGDDTGYKVGDLRVFDDWLYRCAENNSFRSVYEPLRPVTDGDRLYFRLLGRNLENAENDDNSDFTFGL